MESFLGIRKKSVQKLTEIKGNIVLKNDKMKQSVIEHLIYLYTLHGQFECVSSLIQRGRKIQGS